VAPDTIKNDTQFELMVKYKNYGNTPTKAFSILLDPSSDLTIDKDSIRVPALAGQAEANIKLRVTVADITKNPNLSVEFDSVNSLGETISLNQYAYIFTRKDVVNNLGFSGYNFSSVDVFPNPSEGVLSVKVNKGSENVKILIRDSQGAEVLSMEYGNVISGQILDFSIEHLSHGMYFMELQDYKGGVLRREKIIYNNSSK
jgi:hypothetical protein